MKKKLLVLSVLALSGISTATLASCNKNPVSSTTVTTPGVTSSVQKTVTGISVEGQNTVYGINDNIVQGANARVNINYSDGSSTDGTAVASFDFSAVDKTKAGTYTVKVTCSGKETTYTVEVKEYVFTGIEADTANANLNYHLYTVYNFDDVVVNALYKHPVSGEVTKRALNNADVTFTVKNSDGTVIGSQFTALGDYKVEVAYNDAKADFTVKCVAVDVKTVAEAMEVASKTESSIASGSAKYTLAGNYNYTETINYLYGESFVKTTNKRTNKNTYYSVKGDSGFAVTIDADENGADKANATPKIYAPETTDEFLPEVEDAKYIGLNIFKDGKKYYGVYAAVEKLYDEYLALAEIGAEQCVSKVDKCSHLDNADGYSFQYNRLDDSASGGFTFERVTVEFTLNEAGAINKAYINIEKYKSQQDNFYYTADDYKNNKPLPDDLPLEIKSKENEAGNTIKYFVLKDGANASDITTWEFTQESGTKASDSENPYLASKVAVTDFKILDADGNELEDGKQIDIDLDNGNVEKDEGNHRFVFKYRIGEFEPETADINLDEVSVTVSGTGKDGHVLGDSDYSYAFASKSDGIAVYFNRPGNYDVTFKTSSVTKVLHYNVDYEAPYTIKSLINDGEATSSFVSENAFTMYKSNKIYIGANIGDPSGANGDVFEPGFTAVADKDTCVLEKTTLTVDGKEVECYAFTATAAGNYAITLTGATPDSERTAATTTVTITVEENPTLAEILAKYDNKYEAVVSDEEVYTLEFTDNQVTIYNKFNRENYARYNYTYNAEARTFKCNLDDSDGIEKSFTLAMSNYYVLSLVDVDDNISYILNKPTSDITDEELALLNGTYTCSVMGGVVKYSFEFTPGTEKGTGTLVVSVDQGSGTPANYTYTYEFDTSARKLVPTLVTGQESSSPLNGQDITINNDSQLVYSSSFGDVVLEKQSIDYSQIFSGSYEATVEFNETSQVFEFQFTANADDAKTGTLVCITDGNSSKSGTYTYSLDESTGAINVTKTSGKDKYINGCLSLVNGKLYLTKYNNDFELSRKGGSTPEPDEPDTPSVSIPEEMYGTWYSSDEMYDDIVISKDEVKIGSDVATIKSVNGSVIAVNVAYFGDVTITLGDDGLSVLYYGNTNIKYTSTPTIEKVNPLEELVGTWVSEDKTYTIIITTDSIIMNGVEGEIVTSDYDDFDVTFGTVTYNVSASDDSLTLWSRSTGEIKFNKSTSDDSQVDASDYAGTWFTDNGDVLEITSSSVKLDMDSDVLSGNITAVTNEKITFRVVYDEDDCEEFDLVIGEDGTLTYDGQFEFTKVTSESVVIDDEFIGVWKDDEETITLTISASSVKWNEFECDTYSYKEGWLVFKNSDLDNSYIFAKFNSENQKLEFSTSDRHYYSLTKEQIKVDSELQGVYYDDDSDYVLIGSNYFVLYMADEYEITSITKTDSTVEIAGKHGSLIKTISIKDSVVSVEYNGETIEYTKQAEFENISSFEGSWVSTEEEAAGVCYIIENGYVIDNVNGSYYVITACDGNSITVTDGLDEYEFTLQDGILTDDSSDTYTKQTA